MMHPRVTLETGRPFVKSFCRWSGDLGPKINEGDRQAPEGFYTITPGLMNSKFQLLSGDQYRLPERLCLRKSR